MASTQCSCRGWHPSIIVRFTRCWMLFAMSMRTIWSNSLSKSKPTPVRLNFHAGRCTLLERTYRHAHFHDIVFRAQAAYLRIFKFDSLIRYSSCFACWHDSRLGFCFVVSFKKMRKKLHQVPKRDRVTKDHANKDTNQSKGNCEWIQPPVKSEERETKRAETKTTTRKERETNDKRHTIRISIH